jgi:hypothetical protein
MTPEQSQEILDRLAGIHAASMRCGDHLHGYMVGWEDASQAGAR